METKQNPHLNKSTELPQCVPNLDALHGKRFVVLLAWKAIFSW